MIKLRGLFVSDVIDKLPLPKEMKTKIKTIPQLYCEYQRVDRDCKYTSCSPESELDPLARSKALITRGNTCSMGLTQTETAKESNGTYSHVNSSGETVEDAYVRTDDITAKVISQSAHPRNQLQIKTEKEIKVY